MKMAKEYFAILLPMIHFVNIKHSCRKAIKLNRKSILSLLLERYV